MFMFSVSPACTSLATEALQARRTEYEANASFGRAVGGGPWYAFSPRWVQCSRGTRDQGVASLRVRQHVSRAAGSHRQHYNAVPRVSRRSDEGHENRHLEP
jgi:hypothetical protein